MNWTEQFDAYCERTDLTYWSEPINAVTNAAFIIAALVMWRRTAGVPGARLLCIVLFLIGVGSFLFHTHAAGWAALADVAPIGAYILIYLFLTNRDIMGWPLWRAALGTVAFLPYAALLLPILNAVPFVQISNFYWTVPILLMIYAVALRHKHPMTAKGFIIGAALLVLSIITRSVDEIFCAAIPVGTHFLWHCLNGVMLGYMIHIYASHVLAGRPAQR